MLRVPNLLFDRLCHSVQLARSDSPVFFNRLGCLTVFLHSKTTHAGMSLCSSLSLVYRVVTTRLPLIIFVDLVVFLATGLEPPLLFERNETILLGSARTKENEPAERDIEGRNGAHVMWREMIGKRISIEDGHSHRREEIIEQSHLLSMRIQTRRRRLTSTSGTMMTLMQITKWIHTKA